MAPRVVLTLSKVKVVCFSVNCQLAPTASYLKKVLSMALTVMSLDIASYFLVFNFFSIATVQLVLFFPLLFPLSGR